MTIAQYAVWAIRITTIGTALAVAPHMLAVQLLTNGGFETGTFAGWTKDALTGSTAGSDFFVLSGTTLPQSGLTTVGPASGRFYAVSDQGGPETHALRQSFTVPLGSTSVMLSFRLFAASDIAPIIGTAGLDHRDGPNQQARVDLLAGTAGAFDISTGVIRNLFVGLNSGAIPRPYTFYFFDITPNVTPGGTYQLRFAETSNQSFLNLGIDDVSVDAASAAVPEPGSLGLITAGIAALLVRCTLGRRTNAKAKVPDVTPAPV